MLSLLRSALAVALCCLTAAASAQDGRIGALRIDRPFARATAGFTVPGAAYLTIRNEGSQADRLLGAGTPAARAVELHATVREGDVMRMRALTAIDLPPGETVALDPGGRLHLMLIGLKAALKAGDRISLTLRFERAGEVVLSVPVERPGAMAPGLASGHSH